MKLTILCPTQTQFKIVIALGIFCLQFISIVTIMITSGAAKSLMPRFVPHPKMTDASPSIKATNSFAHGLVKIERCLRPLHSLEEFRLK